MLPEDLLFVKNNDDKWAIIKLGDSISQITNYDYEFIGLKDTISSNNLLETNYYIVKKDNLWGIIDNAGDLMSNYLSNEITLYNDILISTKKDNKYYLYDYNGKRVIDENGFNYVSFTDKYINIVDSSSNLYVYDYINSKKIGSNIHLNGPDYKEEFESKLNSENNTIDINADGKDYNFALN